MPFLRPRLPLAASTFAALLLAGCPTAADDDDGSPDPADTFDPAVCQPDAGSFTVDIDNPYFPLPVGLYLVLEGEEDGEDVRVEITVLDETEDVAGVSTRVVEEHEYEGGETVEISRNFIVQAGDGTVCYYGETVDDYEDGQVVGHGGEWRAGEGGALPGVLMPGSPAVGQEFAQEEAPGVAEDMSAVVGTGESYSVPAGDFDDVLHLVDWNPMEGGTLEDGEDKYYASGVGLIDDNGVVLVSY